jgi:DNA-binding MarR family transcriptional regulator
VDALIENKEIELLDAIAQDSRVTQSGLSAQLGIAVGSVNWYIKRLITRGYIKVSRLDRTRLQYDLTPEGMSVLTQRALQYMKDSLKVYNGMRNKAKVIVAELKSRGIQSVYLDGDDEMVDIFQLTCLEGGIAIDHDATRIIVKSDGQKISIEDRQLEQTRAR